MLSLPQVTLICVDCINHEAALVAMRRCMQHCDFARAVLIADRRPDGNWGVLEFAQIERIASREAYSQFMLRKVGDYVQTSHALIVQWDGYVVNPLAWSDDFLRYDYIGAKWWHKEGPNVGNGGFSLRSRKLFDALNSMDLSVSKENEDDVICRFQRTRLEALGVRFADEPTADRFAYERGYEPGANLPFGFHGFFNMWRMLSPAELRSLFGMLDARTIAYLETMELASNYMKAGAYEESVFVCLRALDVNPDLVPALKILCNSAVRLNRSWLSLMALKELSRIEPLNTECCLALGDVYAMYQRPKDAIRQYRKVLELHPGDKVALLKLRQLG